MVGSYSSSDRSPLYTHEIIDEVAEWHSGEGSAAENAAVAEWPATAGKLRGEVMEPGGVRSWSDSANSARNLRALSVSVFSLDSQLSAVNTAISTQLPCFETLAHSFERAQKSLLCFHGLAHSLRTCSGTNTAQPACFQCAAHSFAKHGGYAPYPAAISQPILEVKNVTASASTTSRHSAAARTTSPLRRSATSPLSHFATRSHTA